MVEHMAAPPKAQTDRRPEDMQMGRPTSALRLSRAGVTGVERILALRPSGALSLELDCFVDLAPEQRGAHMSRFEETVNEALDGLAASGGLDVAELAAGLAERVRERQGSLRAEVALRARRSGERPAPASGARSQEVEVLLGRAVASSRSTRRLTGVEAQGLTACPCAQAMVAGAAAERLAGDGFSDEEIERILDAVPVATHNQRGVGTLWVGVPGRTDQEVDPGLLLRIVESSMSSEVYELMKRSDELAVVERAHARPRFVEDCVREMIAGVVRELPALDDGAWVLARQENMESIHRHNVAAERHGMLGELRRALALGEHDARHATMSEWLEGA